ncbi:hypothetical protein EKG83_26095 [Saccharothrix syringae]|uniref:DUF5753 domain-containing protein n=2 Tax=Saccharothrix syringae TaxID=103733 RepID=A0A5Q0H2G7_SACSY|nr:hypothetical protein EKG83_26095 [Saccharothrix syringae]
MTIEEILSVLGWAKVTLLRLEDGRRGKSAWDIARLLGVLHADTETCERVNRLLRQPVTREFVRSHPRRAHDDLAVLAVHEQRAATITTYDRTGVPPLLQTEDYARLDLAYTQDVDHALRIRLDRQKRMYEDWTPETPAVFYIHESALSTPVPDDDATDVMCNQLLWLAFAGREFHRRVRLVPAARHGPRHPFTLMTFARPLRSLAYTGTATATVFTEGHDAVYRPLVAELDRIALDPDRTVEELHRRADALSGTAIHQAATTSSQGHPAR